MSAKTKQPGLFPPPPKAPQKFCNHPDCRAVLVPREPVGFTAKCQINVTWACPDHGPQVEVSTAR